MRKTVLLLCALGLLLTLAGGVGFAIPSLGGPTGIVSVPTAQVLPMNDVDLALSYQTIKVEGMYDAGDSAALSLKSKLGAAQAVYGGSTTDTFHVWTLQGLAGLSGNTEGWASFSTVNTDERETVWGLGAKTQLPSRWLLGGRSGAALAAGTSYQRWSDVGNMWKLYLTATADLRGPAAQADAVHSVFGTLGLMYMRAEPEEGSNQSALEPFLGVEAGLTKDTKFGAEYRFKDSDIDSEAVWSLVLRHAFDQQFSAEIGITNASPVGTGLDDQGLFVRVGYHLPY